MGLTVLSKSILKPFPSSSDELNHATFQKAALNIFDKVALNVYVSALHPFQPPQPSNELLKKTLSRALTYYPHLAGRFAEDERGQQCILLNNAGIGLIETYVADALDDLLPFNPSNDLSHLYPSAEGTDDLLRMQLNRFACGGLILGYSCHHRVADGHSFSSFLAAWSRLIRGLQIHQIPNHDRAGFLVPRSPRRVEFDHQSIEFKKNTSPDTPAVIYPIEKVLISYTRGFIEKIKAKVVEENITPKPRYSTFKCLLTHVWKKITQARGLNLEQFTEARISVNGRGRASLAVPGEFFGNMVLFAYPRLTVREVLTESYGYVANAIQNAVDKIDSDYFQSFTDFGDMCKRNGEELQGFVPETGNLMSPNLEVDSWLGFNFHDLDFGGGPCKGCLPDIPVEGVVVFLPSSKDQGDGVDVIASLLPQHANHFKQISLSL